MSDQKFEPINFDPFPRPDLNGCYAEVMERLRKLDLNRSQYEDADILIRNVLRRTSMGQLVKNNSFEFFMNDVINLVTSEGFGRGEGNLEKDIKSLYQRNGKFLGQDIYATHERKAQEIPHHRAGHNEEKGVSPDFVSLNKGLIQVITHLGLEGSYNQKKCNAFLERIVEIGHKQQVDFNKKAVNEHIIGTIVNAILDDTPLEDTEESAKLILFKYSPGPQKAPKQDVRTARPEDAKLDQEQMEVVTEAVRLVSAEDSTPKEKQELTQFFTECLLNPSIFDEELMKGNPKAEILSDVMRNAEPKLGPR